jgi:hypothetical protein
MDPDASAEKIRRRMAELRRELECDVRQVSDDARTMTDWTFYVRRFPWAVAAVAAAAGFMLIPKRKQVIKPDPEMLAELVKNKKVKVQQVASTNEKQGFIKPLLLTAVTWAARQGFQYFTQQLKDGAFTATSQRTHGSQSARDPHNDPTWHEPSPSPLTEPWKSKSISEPEF